MPGQGLIGVKTRTIHQFDCGSKLTHTVSSEPSTNITSQPDTETMIDRLQLHSKPTIVNDKSKTR